MEVHDGRAEGRGEGEEVGKVRKRGKSNRGESESASTSEGQLLRYYCCVELVFLRGTFSAQPGDYA